LVILVYLGFRNSFNNNILQKWKEADKPSWESLCRHYFRKWKNEFSVIKTKASWKGGEEKVHILWWWLWW